MQEASFINVAKLWLEFLLSNLRQESWHLFTSAYHFSLSWASWILCTYTVFIEGSFYICTNMYL
jgi:hypothetical protein